MDHSLPHDSDIKPIIDQTLWQIIDKLLPTTYNELPFKAGKIENLTIWLVDGDQVRHKYYMDFSYGGHDLVYGKNNTEYKELDFIPPNQIWLDGHLDKQDLKFTLYHEIIERRLMQQGMRYNGAHAVANLSEKQITQPQTEDITHTIANLITEDPDIFN